MNFVDNHTDHASLVSSEIADWTREKPRQFWDPGRKLLLSIRRYQYWHQRRGIIAGVICKGLVLRHRFWSVIKGPVRIGDHTRIGANAVVTKDVPSHTTAV